MGGECGDYGGVKTTAHREVEKTREVAGSVDIEMPNTGRVGDGSEGSESFPSGRLCIDHGDKTGGQDDFIINRKGSYFVS